MDFILSMLLLLMFSYYHHYLFLITGIDGNVNHLYSDLMKEQLHFLSCTGRGYRWSRLPKPRAWAQGKPFVSNDLFEEQWTGSRWAATSKGRGKRLGAWSWQRKEDLLQRQTQMSVLGNRLSVFPQCVVKQDLNWRLCQETLCWYWFSSPRGNKLAESQQLDNEQTAY